MLINEEKLREIVKESIGNIITDNIEQDILKEELSISTDVNNITLKIKSILGNDYKKNYSNPNNYKLIDDKLTKQVFYNDVDVKYQDIVIKITYYVLESNNNELISYYKSRFNSKTQLSNFHLKLYLTSYDGVINWIINSMSIQHEVEHLFQYYKKNKPLLPIEKMKEYHALNLLTNSNDFYEQIIGHTYYYYVKVERNAIINGLYRKIMDMSNNGATFNPLDIIKDTPFYDNIKTIKEVIINSKNYPEIEKRLIPYNKTLKSFLRLANRMVDEYTKAFGRLLYKVKKDIEENNKDTLINYSERKIKK